MERFFFSPPGRQRKVYNIKGVFNVIGFLSFQVKLEDFCEVGKESLKREKNWSFQSQVAAILQEPTRAEKSLESNCISPRGAETKHFGLKTLIDLERCLI